MSDEWKDRVGVGVMVLLMSIGIGSCSFLEQLGRKANLYIEIIRPMPTEEPKE